MICGKFKDEESFFEYRSSSYLTEFFSDCDTDFTHDGSRPPPGRRESMSVIPHGRIDFTRRPLPSIFSICARNDSMAGSGRKFLADFRGRVQYQILYLF